MASKKKQQSNPNVQKRVAERRAFVQSKPDLAPAEARKRFYVNTRAAELKAAGKEVNRQALRRNFETGNIQRAGFQTQGDIQRAAAVRAANAKSVETSKSSSTLPAPSAVSRRSQQAMMDVRRKSVSGFKSGNVQKSSVKPSKPTTGSGTTDFLTKAIDKGVGAGGVAFRGIDKLMTGVRKEVLSQGESLNATFLNPAFNQTVGRINPKLRQREAGPVEAAVNVASVALGTPGGASITAKIGSKILPKIPIVGRLSRLGPKLADEIALFSKEKFPSFVPDVKVPTRPAGTARPTGPGGANIKGPRPTAPGGANIKGPRPVPPSVRAKAPTAPKPVKPVTKKATPPVKKAPAKKTPAPVAKAPAKKAPAPVAKAPAKKRPPLKTSPRSKPKTFEIGDMSGEVTFNKPLPKKTPLNKVKGGARTVKPPAKKVSSPKAPEPVKPPAKKSNPKTSTGPSSTSGGTVSRMPQRMPDDVPTFKTQAEYDKFADSGEMKRWIDRQMSTGNTKKLEAYTARNRRFIGPRGERKTVQARARQRATTEQKINVQKINEENKRNLGAKFGNQVK